MSSPKDLWFVPEHAIPKSKIFAKIQRLMQPAYDTDIKVFISQGNRFPRHLAPRKLPKMTFFVGTGRPKLAFRPV
jgi:hypothetical protein